MDYEGNYYATHRQSSTWVVDYIKIERIIDGMEYVDMIKRGDENNNGSVTDPDKIISFKSL